MTNDGKLSATYWSAICHSVNDKLSDIRISFLSHEHFEKKVPVETWVVTASWSLNNNSYYYSSCVGLSEGFLESEVDLGIRDQLLRLALGKDKPSIHTQTTQYRHCLQSIFHKGAPRGGRDKRRRENKPFNPVKESAGERKEGTRCEHEKPVARNIVLKSTLAFNLRLHCQVYSLFYIPHPIIQHRTPYTPHAFLSFSISLPLFAKGCFLLSLSPSIFVFLFPHPFPLLSWTLSPVLL